MIYKNDNVFDPLESEETLASTLSFYFVIVGVTLYLLISSSLLVTWGIPYDIPGGSPLAKFHPGTYCIGIGFLIYLLTRKQEIYSPDWLSMFLFLVCTISTALYALIRFGPNGIGYFLDTLIAPGLLGIVLMSFNQDRKRFLFHILLVILFINALIGIAEVILQDRLIAYLVDGEPVIEEYFRATALGGHPLANAHHTIQIALVSLIYEDYRQLFLLPIFYLAMLAFGSRVAFVLLSVFLILWSLRHFFSNLMSRVLDIRLMFFILFGTIAGVVIIGIFLSQGTFGGRIFAELYLDESAQARASAFNAFQFMTLETWLFGGGPDFSDATVEYLKSNHDMSAIENFWILLILQLGIVPLFFFIPSFLMMLYHLSRKTSLSLQLCTISFIILTSSTNSLASKSQSLALFIAMIISARAESEFINQNKNVLPTMTEEHDG